MEPTESFSEASLNFFNKFDVVFYYWRISFGCKVTLTSKYVSVCVLIE